MTTVSFAQEADPAVEEVSNSIFETRLIQIITLMIGALLILVVFLLLVFSDRIIKFSANKAFDGDESKESKYRLFPGRDELMAGDAHKVAGSDHVFKLDRGMDIRIEGEAKKEIKSNFESSTFAVKPIDFNGLKPIPKMMVAEGDEVKAGDPLFYDKLNPDMYFTAPVSGEVAEIRRGPKRAIHEVVILADKDIKFKDFGKQDPNSMDRDAIKKLMLESGIWTKLIERPFGVTANMDTFPRDIYVSTFDSAPLAIDMNFAVEGEKEAFQVGVNALAKLTDGDVTLGMNASKQPSDVFQSAQNCVKYWFEGAHPAG